MFETNGLFGNLSGAFKRNWHNPNESSVPDAVIHLEIRKQKCRYQDSKVPNQSELTCLTDELRKNNESPNLAGEMLQQRGSEPQ